MARSFSASNNDSIDVNIKTTYQNFEAASNFVQNYNGYHQILPSKNTPQFYDFHALFMQATEGPFTMKKGTLSKEDGDDNKLQGKAWKRLGNMTKLEAMAAYVKELDNIVDGWRHWRGLSRTKKNESPVSSSSNNISSPEDEMFFDTSGTAKVETSNNEEDLDQQCSKDVKSMNSKISQYSVKLIQLEKKLLDLTESEKKVSSEIGQELVIVQKVRDDMVLLSKQFKQQMHQQNESFHEMESQCNKLTKQLLSAKKMAIESRGNLTQKLIALHCIALKKKANNGFQSSHSTKSTGSLYSD